jgi:hypothetical protein
MRSEYVAPLLAPMLGTGFTLFTELPVSSNSKDPYFATLSDPKQHVFHNLIYTKGVGSVSTL